MSGVLCLKWNNHTTTFIHSLDSLRLKESYCDATIACCGRYYPVHRFVLGTCSDYFEEIFARTPCKHPFIVLKDVNNFQLEALLNYMYKGEVNVLQDNLPDLIRAAEALKVKGLTVSEDGKQSQELEEIEEQSLSSIVVKERLKGKGSKVTHSSPVRVKPETGDREQKNEKEHTHNDQNTHSRLSSTTLECEKQSQISTTNEKSDIILPTSNNQDDDDDLNIEEDGIDIKCEPLDAEEATFQTTNVQNESNDQTFVSLLSPNFYPDKDTKESSDIVNGFHGFEMPQCSAWTDNLASSDALSKEVDQSSWMQSSDYDSFSLDPLHYLATNGAVSPSYSTSALDDPSLDTKEKSRDKTSFRTKKGSGPKYQCTQCSFKTSDKAAFRLHEMRKHTGEKPFPCTICSYRCTTKDMLKIHTRKHTGERPFSCPYCSCRMAVKSSLKRHILLKHIQPRKPKSQSSSSDTLITMGIVKAYKCSFCSYESQMKSNLKLHCMRIHTGEKPVACALCPYRTTTKPQLEKHMRKHTGEKPFSCTFCSYKAAQKHSLLRHMSLHVK